MKKTNVNQKSNFKVNLEKDSQLPLVPIYILLPLWFVSLAVPNLVYSGVNFADTLHILKWAITGIPVAVAGLVAGLRLLFYGRGRIKFKLDLFSAIWALMIAYASVQPYWVDVFSPTALLTELICLFTVWAFYVISFMSFTDRALKPILFFAAVNAAINVGFAELQLPGYNNLAFLIGTPFEFLCQYSSIILPTPSNYIGNTAQNNMLALWCAINLGGLVYLLIFDIWNNNPDYTHKRFYFPALCVALIALCLTLAIGYDSVIFYVISAALLVSLFILAWKLGNTKSDYLTAIALLLFTILFWGLLKSISRSGLFGFLTGFSALIIIALWKFRKVNIFRFFALFLIMAVLSWSSTYSPRADGFIERTKEVVEQTNTVAGRIGIWTTSYSMFKEHPMGVGTGQFKWHYLEAQREGFKTEYVNRDWYVWQYTHWAHNEFLQWFCEGGWIGGIMLITMYLVWFIAALIGVSKTKRGELNITAVWGIAVVFIISFTALFTRPFHRVENMVWISLAFAISNRAFLTSKLSFNIAKSGIFTKILGLACIAASVAGTIYICGGIKGNYILRQALSTSNPGVQIYLLNQADEYPITHEDAQRHIALHYLELGEQTENMDDIQKGFITLWEHFQREPHSEDITRLLNLSQRFQVEGVLVELASYFKPGAYKLVRRPMKTADGRLIDALVLVNAAQIQAPENHENQENESETQTSNDE